MCDNPAKECPQDSSIITGTVNTMCFPNGTYSDDGKFYFRDYRDLANQTIMDNVFLHKYGSTVCTDPRYKLSPLPSTVQQAKDVSQKCITPNGLTQGAMLPNWCVGNNPPSDLTINTNCCAGLTPSNRCPQGYCPNSDACVDPMTEWCRTRDISDNVCQSYFTNSMNDSAKKTIINNIVSYKRNNPGPCQKELKGNPCIDTYTNFCKMGPFGACDEFLYDQCSKYTRDDLNNDTKLSQLCGCHLSAPEYNKYKDLKVPGGVLQKQCDPLCNDIQTIQVGNNCLANTCSQTVCIIDFTNENIQEMMQNGIYLNQNCYGSPGAGATCIVSMTVKDAQQLIEENVSVNQNCGSCKIYDPSNPEVGLTSLDCTNLKASIANYFKNPPKPPSKRSYTLYIIIGIGIILLAIAIFGYKLFF